MEPADDPEPGAAPAPEGPRAGPVSAGRDVYVAGRDIVVNVNAAGAGGGSGDRDGNSPGLGERLFAANVGAHSGKLAVAFGSGGTLVVTEQDGAVHRWSLADGAGLPGVPGGGIAPLRIDMMYGMGTQTAVSTVAPALAIARGARFTIVRFTDGGYRTTSVPLGRNELLLAGSGERFATYDDHRVAVRDFADGTVVWEQPCPRSVVTAALDERGTTVAVASSPNWLAPSNRFTVARQGDQRSREFAFANLKAPGAACRLALSPGGELAVCASFREVLLTRPETGEIVQRRRVTSVREEIVPSLGLRPHRLICMADGQVLWMRGRRVVDVNWAGEKFRYLPQDGLCDDIAFDHANSRLAIVSESGQVSVFKWRHPRIGTGKRAD